MDIEVIKNKLVNNEQKKYNKKIAKKIIMSEFILNQVNTYHINNFISKLIDDDFSEEEMQGFNKAIKEAYREEKNKFMKFLKEMFGEEKTATVISTDTQDTEGSAESEEEGEE